MNKLRDSYLLLVKFVNDLVDKLNQSQHELRTEFRKQTGKVGGKVDSAHSDLKEQGEITRSQITNLRAEVGDLRTLLLAQGDRSLALGATLDRLLRESAALRASGSLAGNDKKLDEIKLTADDALAAARAGQASTVKMSTLVMNFQEQITEALGNAGSSAELLRRDVLGKLTLVSDESRRTSLDIVNSTQEGLVASLTVIFNSHLAKAIEEINRQDREQTEQLVQMVIGLKTILGRLETKIGDGALIIEQTASKSSECGLVLDPFKLLPAEAVLEDVLAAE